MEESLGAGVELETIATSNSNDVNLDSLIRDPGMRPPISSYLKSYINFDDDVHVNIATLGHTLVKHRKKKKVYIRCMKSCPVLAQKLDVEYIDDRRLCCGTPPGIAVEMMKQGATTTVLSFLLSVLVLPARLVALTDIIDNRQG
ncbi:probable beta-1,3-galactosyltransferase 2 isoform X1 [Tanacetum coccineum]